VSAGSRGATGRVDRKETHVCLHSCISSICRRGGGRRHRAIPGTCTSTPRPQPPRAPVAGDRRSVL